MPSRHSAKRSICPPPSGCQHNTINQPRSRLSVSSSTSAGGCARVRWSCACPAACNNNLQPCRRRTRHRCMPAETATNTVTPAASDTDRCDSQTANRGSRCAARSAAHRNGECRNGTISEGNCMSARLSCRRNRAARGFRQRHGHHQILRKTSVLLVPPNPKELEMATSIGI